MNKNLQPTSVDGIEFDALIDSSETYDATVPEYPVETGFTVSDTIIINADTLDMMLYLSNTPVTWGPRFGNSSDRVQAIVDHLKELFFEKKLITVTTSDQAYTDMSIINIAINKSLTVGYAREIPIKFQKVRITETQTTTIPDSYGKSGTTEAAAGTANTTTATATTASSSESSSDSTKSGSILYNVYSSASSALSGFFS